MVIGTLLPYDHDHDGSFPVVGSVSLVLVRNDMDIDKYERLFISMPHTH